MIFDKASASLLANAVQISYDRNPAALKEWGGKRGLQTLGFQGADTQGFFITADNAMYIVFRGTEPDNLRDWHTDAGALRIPSDHAGGSVHQGFSHALDAVWRTVNDAVSGRGNRLVFISGHSLGGALAVLAASRLQGIPLHLYTFGQPRVGNDEFAKSCEGMFGSTYFRFVNDKDIVPRVPPFIAGYRHFGHELQIDAEGKLHEGDFGVETITDAVRLAAGARVPKTVSAVGVPLLGVVSSVLRGKIGTGPETNAIELIKENPGALESITDHDAAIYLRAVENA